MNLKRRKKQYATARERFIEPALMNFLKAEFPSLGGKRVRMLFVEELMKILDKFYYPRDKIKALHSQIDNLPCGKRIHHNNLMLHHIYQD